MGERVLPAPDAPAEEWGRIAVSLPGWRWMPGMFVPSPGYGRLDDDDVSDHPLYRLPLRHADECWPDPDDPATAGCLLALLGRQVSIRQRGHWVAEWRGMAPLAPGIGSVKREVTGRGPTLGRACIAAAEALGRWPGGGTE